MLGPFAQGLPPAANPGTAGTNVARLFRGAGSEDSIFFGRLLRLGSVVFVLHLLFLRLRTVKARRILWLRDSGHRKGGRAVRAGLLSQGKGERPRAAEMSFAFGPSNLMVKSRPWKARAKAAGQ